MTLIDKSDAFVFGYSKLDVMFGRDAARGGAPPVPRVREARRSLRCKETVTAIDPEARGVTTDAGEYEADILVVALGADYDLRATPGLAEAGNEFYSVAGAERVREVLPDFSEGGDVVGVCGAPFKCPPAPSEAALLLHDYLSARGVREQCEITVRDPVPEPRFHRPRRRPRRCSPPSPSATSSSSRAPRIASLDADREAWPCSTTAASSPTTSSSGCPSTAPPTW